VTPESPSAPSGSDLTPAECELARWLARELVERRLGAPALFLLEGIRPLNFVLSQVLAFFSPIINIIRDQSKIDQFQELLEKRESIPYICNEIHQLEEARRG
jgi:hypothetical protein